jgi:putative oxidoreductase
MIWGHLSRYRNLGLLVLRVSVGLYMAIGHGWGKILGGPEQWAQLGGVMEGIFGFVVLPTVWGFLAAVAEFVGALLVTVGLLTRPAALVLVLNMAVAALAHITGVIEGSPESALIYGVVFLSLVLVGPGAYSIDGDA